MIKYSLTALTLLATPALAQDSAVFGGPYAGAIAGYDHVILSDGTDSASKDGLAYGAVIGYDAALGRGVIGVEGEISGSTAKERARDVFATGDTVNLHAARDLYAGIRGGFLVTPDTLVYVKGGYVNGRANVSYTLGGTTTTDGSSVDGWRVGAGIEQAFGLFKARLEYRYSDYGQFSYASTNLGIDAKRHQVVAGLFANF
jgi:outer membrane immunogenic protein